MRTVGWGKVGDVTMFKTYAIGTHYTAVSPIRGTLNPLLLVHRDNDLKFVTNNKSK